jgi:hypothetical protein
MKGAAPSPSANLLVGSVSLAQRDIIQDGEVCAQSWIQLVNTLQDGTRSIGRRNFAPTEHRRQLGE